MNCIKSKKLNLDENFKDLTKDTIIYLSSAREGNGIYELIDNDLSTFWQSNKNTEDQEPHYINTEFLNIEKIYSVCLYLNYENDESYTPSHIKILAGLYQEDLELLIDKRLDKPNGWYIFSFLSKSAPYINCINIRIEIYELHDSGKDCHLRQIKFFTKKISSENLKSNYSLSSNMIR